MISVLGSLLPLAAGIAICPLPIVAVILMLFSERADRNGPAFLLGWFAGLVAVGGIALAVSSAASVATNRTPSKLASTITLLLGLLLLAAGGRQWRQRPAPGEPA